MWLDIGPLLQSRRVILCCGSGGVGKTTTAAALGLLAARSGLRVLVMTIDPARRLAQALGLEAIGDEPQRVVLDAPGELWAMMQDGKRAFDRLVAAYAPSAEVRDAILANAYYQQLSGSLGGSHELVAMEQVLEVAESAAYDLLVVDTPPTRHALDFLDAPARLVKLLDGSFTHLLLRPYGLAARAQFNLFRQSSSVALKFFERLTGVQMMADLSDFLLAFSSLFDDFKARSARLERLLRDPRTGFVLVCAPEPLSLAQVDQFLIRLRADGMQVDGLIANRVHPRPAGAETETRFDDAERRRLDACAEPGRPSLAERLRLACDDAVALHAGDLHALTRHAAADLPQRVVAELDHEPHSVTDLARFAAELAGTEGDPAGAGQP